jgi:DnaJ-class molecular chaperone
MTAVEVDGEYDRLRAKYAEPGYHAQLRSKDSGNAAPRQPGGASEDKLSKIRICGSCQAMGYVTKQYGYRVLQECCPECNGEGLLGTTQPADATTADHARRQRITQLEASIASADSLDELEKLEAELRALRPEI